MAEPKRIRDGIRAVEAATQVFAPAAAMHYCRLLDSRNQRSVVLHPAEPSGLEVLRRLVRAADVFVTNCLPAVLETPSLIYVECGHPRPAPEWGTDTVDVLRSLNPED